jgi:hypothetical protein
MFAGLNVSANETSVCIVDDSGRIVREVKVASEPGALLQALRNSAYHLNWTSLRYQLGWKTLHTAGHCYLERGKIAPGRAWCGRDHLGTKYNEGRDHDDDNRHLLAHCGRFPIQRIARTERAGDNVTVLTLAQKNSGYSLKRVGCHVAAETDCRKGLAGALFEVLRTHMGNRPAMTFVRTDNAVGMRDFGTFVHEDVPYVAFKYP